MWCITTHSTYCLSASFTSPALHTGPLLRSNPPLASCSTISRACCSRPCSGLLLRSITGRSTAPASSMICSASPSSCSKCVRSASCLSTICWMLRLTASPFKPHRQRDVVGGALRLHLPDEPQPSLRVRQCYLLSPPHPLQLRPL